MNDLALFDKIEKRKKNNSRKRKAIIGGATIVGLGFGAKPLLKQLRKYGNNKTTVVNGKTETPNVETNEKSSTKLLLPEPRNLSNKNQDIGRGLNLSVTPRANGNGGIMSQLRNDSSQIYRQNQDLGNRGNQLAPPIFPNNPLLQNAKNLSGDMRGVLKRRQKMKSNTRTSPTIEQRNTIQNIQNDWKKQFNNGNNLDILPYNQSNVPEAQAIIQGRADLNLLKNYNEEGVLPPNSKLKPKAKNILYDYSRLKNNTGYDKL